MSNPRPYVVFRPRLNSSLFTASCIVCHFYCSGFDRQYNARAIIREHVMKEHPERVNWIKKPKEAKSS